MVRAIRRGVACESVVDVSEPPPPWETEERETYRVRFGEDVDAYDRTRPIAPGAVFDDIVGMAQLAHGSTVLEIGPGTGQATRMLAQRGLRVLALEIDSRLAVRARQNLAAMPNAEVRETSFEAFCADGMEFDAVLACNSFHWLDPDLRFAKSADLLAPGGHLVILSTPEVIPSDADRFWWDVQDDWEAVGAERVDPQSKHPDLVGHFDSSNGASGHFEEPVTVRRPFDLRYSALDYVANLSTQSGFRQLAADAGAELLKRVHRRIEASGGAITVHRLAVLTVARRCGT